MLRAATGERRIGDCDDTPTSGRTSIHIVQTVQIHRESNDTSNEESTGTKITVDNATRFLDWHEEYGVLICVVHGYAVRNLADHLRRYHLGSTKEKASVVKQYRDYQLLKATEVPLPEPLQEPFDALGTPQKAFVCVEPECEHISINKNGIRIHCNTKHGWKATENEREY